MLALLAPHTIRAESRETWSLGTDYQRSDDIDMVLIKESLATQPPECAAVSSFMGLEPPKNWGANVSRDVAMLFVSDACDPDKTLLEMSLTDGREEVRFWAVRLLSDDLNPNRIDLIGKLIVRGAFPGSYGIFHESEGRAALRRITSNSSDAKLLQDSLQSSFYESSLMSFHRWKLSTRISINDFLGVNWLKVTKERSQRGPWF